MKKHSFACEIVIFCTIFLFFVLPSLFTVTIRTGNYLIDFKSFPLVQFAYCLLGIFIFVFFKDSKEKKNEKYFIFYKVIFPATFTFCVLFGINLAFTFISKILPESIGPFFLTNNVEITKPDSLITYVFCILNFIFASIYEEFIYRFYITDSLYNMISRKSEGKNWIFVCEVFAMLVFAFCHLYLGLLSVINAAIAHIILRNCYKKCGCIYTTILAHFCYNLLVFILL